MPKRNRNDDFVRLSLSLFMTALLLAAMTAGLVGCGASRPPEKEFVVETRYVFLEVPEHLLQDREVADEPTSRSRKALVRWQTHILNQLLLSNRDKEELRLWLSDAKKRWGSQTSKGERNGTNHSR